MSHTKQKALLFSMLLSAVVAQYGSAPLPPQLHPVHQPPPPLFGGQAPKKQQHKQLTPSVPIFKPSIGLGPLPVPSGLGPLPLPAPSGLGPLPSPAGQMSMSGPSYSYGSQSNGFPSSFQQLPQPSFQSQRPWQPAPSVPAPQMNFAPLAVQQGVPQSYAVPSIYQQPTASVGSVPSKFLSPPPPPSFPAPFQFGAPTGNPVMQPSFPVAQSNQYTQSMPTYGNAPSMMQMQQNPESFSFGNVPQRELAPNGPSAQYAPSQFGPSGPSSYGSVETPQQFQVSSAPSQSFGPVSSPQSFAIPAPQQSPSESSQSYSPAQSYHTSQPSASAEPQFAPVESQQTFGPSSSSQSFAVASSYAPSNGGPSQVEGPSMHDMPVPIFGIPPPSQPQSAPEYQQVSSTPVRQESYPEHLLPMLYQSAAALASAHQLQPGSEPAGPSSGSPYDGSIFTRHVRVADSFPSA